MISSGSKSLLIEYEKNTFSNQEMFFGMEVTIEHTHALIIE